MGSKIHKVEHDVIGRVFAIGDIHGCPRELEALLNHFTKRASLLDDDIVIFIGDYVDRGPDSCGVIELLLSFQEEHEQVVFLKGNHEDMFLGYLDLGGANEYDYLYNGGVACLESYGASPEAPLEEILEHIPESHIDFLLGLKDWALLDDFIFAHAGVNPLKTLDEQTQEDLLWIRDEFITNVHAFEKTVVFGHTPYEHPLFHLPYKIGIDTGLVFGNRLTAVELTEGKVYSVERNSKRVRTKRFPKK